MTPRLRFGVGGFVSCMSRLIHPSKHISEKYPNRPKAHKLEDLILIVESKISIRRGGSLANVYKFLHLNLPDVIFYAAKRYVHMKLEVSSEEFFVVVEATLPQVRRQVNQTEIDSRIGGVDATTDIPNLNSGKPSNLTAGDMADLRRQCIATDDDNDTAPENIPGPAPASPNEQLTWKLDGIICPRRANNLQNLAACLMNYTREEVMKMKKLELFIVLFPVEYLLTMLISETNKELDQPMDLGEFIHWLGCWFYMACWVGIYSPRDWWSTSDPSIFQ